MQKQQEPAGIEGPVTFAELIDLVQQKLDRSNVTTRPGRTRLLDVVKELRGAGTTADDDLLDDGRRWWLTGIEVQGFRGVSNPDMPLTLDLPTVPGITVVHGENGTGKSSIADAVGTALTGTHFSRSEDDADLWRIDPHPPDAPATRIALLLSDGTDRLAVEWLGEPDGAGRSTVTAGGPHGGCDTELPTSWREAITWSGTVYSYGDLQARLRSPRNLQDYLQDLLALGPVWQRVQDEIDVRAGQSKSASDQLTRLRDEARAAIKEIDERFSVDPREPATLPDIAWDRPWSYDPDAWAADHELADSRDVLDHDVPTAHEATIASRAKALRAALDALDTAESALDVEVPTTIIDGLNAIADHADHLDPERCPLCGQSASWLDPLRTLLDATKGRQRCAEALGAQFASTKTLIETEVRPLLDAATRAGLDADPVRAPVDKFRQAVERDGQRPTAATRSSAASLAEELSSPRYAGLVAAIRSASDASTEWTAERCAAIRTLVEQWRHLGASAADAKTWKTAVDTLAGIKKELRQSRQNGLTRRLTALVSRLLPDAGIEISEIVHKGGAKQLRGVDVALRIAGRPATLGMLSSGQRNALLLGPLLCVPEQGPFGFLVIDDPVHALDDTRIDLLAAELERLAGTRRVLVLTHDSRLEEHLRARCPDTSVVALTRDAATGTVHANPQTSPWEQLLSDADQVLNAATDDEWQIDIGPLETVVGGLCRHAVDGALRQLTVTWAAAAGEDVDATLQRLKRKHSTPHRLDHVASLVDTASDAPVAEARTRCAPHLSRWSNATHGGAPDPDLLRAGVAAARSACKRLTDWRLT